MSHQYPPQQQYQSQQYPPYQQQPSQSYPPYNSQQQQQSYPARPQQSYNQPPPPQQAYNNGPPPAQLQQQRPAYQQQPPPANRRPAPSASQRNDTVKRPKPSSGSKPTTKPSSAPSQSAPANDNRPKVKSQFVIDIEYTNALPDIPFEPKLLKLHYDESFVTRHCHVDFDDELNKPTVYHSLMVNTDVDMIDSERYDRPADIPYGAIDPADLALFDPTIVPAVLATVAEGKSGIQQQLPSNRALIQQNTFNWLKKDIYLSNNLAINVNTKHHDADRSAFNRAGVKRDIDADGLSEKDRQIKLIEQTFADAKLKPVHSSKKHLTVKSVQHVMPDDALIRNDAGADNETQPPQFAWIEFDVDPLKKYHNAENAEEGKSAPAATADASSMMLHTYDTQRDMDNTVHHGLYVRDDSKISEQIANIQNEHITAKQHYTWLREYSQIPAPVVQSNNNYYFTFRDGGVYYGRYERRVRVSKRTVDRRKQAESLVEIAGRPAAIDVLHVDDLSAEIDVGETVEDEKTNAASDGEPAGSDADEDAQEQNDDDNSDNADEPVQQDDDAIDEDEASME